ncbi:hypothetical protein BOX15_Mlig008653g1 [Macrostomum lignano]|uniref:Alpha/beta hydrolase fold-3 domain-containing protein n=1 Tax=Macrostomum lignano TaxID=282301 RepID=A0A267E014_9PLAT|nr:hypothetical protein BOX15_Mlig008653g1 [Macrostomum lignano]
MKSQKPSPAILFLHGGGYVLNSPAEYSYLTGNLSSSLGVPVFSPDYRKSPTWTHPAALEDALATLRHLRSNAEAYGRTASIPSGFCSAGTAPAATSASASPCGSCRLARPCRRPCCSSTLPRSSSLSACPATWRIDSTFSCPSQRRAHFDWPTWLATRPTCRCGRPATTAAQPSGRSWPRSSACLSWPASAPRISGEPDWTGPSAGTSSPTGTGCCLRCSLRTSCWRNFHPASRRPASLMYCATRAACSTSGWCEPAPQAVPEATGTGATPQCTACTASCGPVTHQPLPQWTKPRPSLLRSSDWTKTRKFVAVLCSHHRRRHSSAVLGRHMKLSRQRRTETR